MRRKLQLHQEMANEQHKQQLQMQQQLQQRQQHQHSPLHLNQQQQPVMMAVANMGYQQVENVGPPMASLNPQQPAQVVYGGQMEPARECPIHSSPIASSESQQQAERSFNGHTCRQIPPAEDAYHAHQGQHERNCRTMRRHQQQQHPQQQFVELNKHQQQDAHCEQTNEIGTTFTLNHQNLVINLAKKFNKSIPLRLFQAVFEKKLRHDLLAEEYEQLPRPEFNLNGKANQNEPEKVGSDNRWLKLKPQLVVSRDDSVSALISGRDRIEASLIKMPLLSNSSSSLVRGAEKRIIVAKSPLDADSVWDFWRLIYELEVETLVMLTQTEDLSTGELRCAQYWPTQDNEETTILSPCNEFVQRSQILPAKFKIKQETLNLEDDLNEQNLILKLNDHVKVRRLTLVVMATKPEELDTNKEENSSSAAAADRKSTRSNSTINEDEATSDEDEMIIVERNVLHIQYYHWNTGSMVNQMKLIKFIELANQKHLNESLKVQESPGEMRSLAPMLVHCYTGLGRSGLFTAMSWVIDELTYNLNFKQHSFMDSKEKQVQQVQKINLFQIVSKLRLQRDMLLSPYRFYELLYQLTLNCLPNQREIPANPTQLAHNHHTNHNHHHRQHSYHYHH